MRVSKETFNLFLVSQGVEIAAEEHRFHDKRRFRFDFAWPDKKVAVEIDGVHYSSAGAPTRHQQAGGFIRDREKDNLAIEMGWVVLHYVPIADDFKSGRFIEQLKNVLAARRGVVATS